MSFIDSIFTIKCKKGIFTIILTAIMLTIFEAILFYKFEVPNFEDKMKNNITKISKKIASNINNENKIIRENPLKDIMLTQKMELVFNDTNEKILKTFADREKKLIDTMNQYTIYTNIVLLLILVIFLYMIWNSIKYDEHIGTIINGNMQNSDMIESILTALFIVVIIIGFYISFHFFSNSYNYLGSIGNEEVTWDIINEINVPNISESESESNY